MPYTKVDLQNLYNLSVDEVNQTLTAAGLADDNELYPDEEIQSSFETIRNYFNSEQVSDYMAAAELFKQHQTGTQQLEAEPQSKIKKKPNANKMKDSQENDVEEGKRLNVLELIALANKQCQVEIELTEALSIMPSCGLLPNQKQFTPAECDRFLKACTLVKKQNKSSTEVAAHFGMSDDESDPDNLQQIVGQISDSTVSAESGLVRLVDKVTEKRADAIPGLVNKLYLKNVSRKLIESQINTDIFFAELEERIMAQIEGKSPAHSLGGTWEWELNSLTPSSPKPMSLSEGSDNGMSDESNNR